MTTNKVFKLVVTGSIVAVLVFAVAMLSCDKRRAVNATGNEGQERSIGNVLVLLMPNQVYLPSPQSVDTVLVLIAVADTQGVGMSGVKPTVTRSPARGLLTESDTTDATGATFAAYVTEPGVYLVDTIFVTAGSITRSAALIISGPSDYTMNLTYSPPVPKMIDHLADPYTIKATLVDNSQRGVGGQAVIFSILNQVGRLGFADSSVTIPYTNSQGIVEALFYNTEVDEITLPDSVIIQAYTQAPDTGLLAVSVSIPLRQVQNRLILEANPTEVFGDGSSGSNIRAFLLDTDGHGIVDDTIYFSNPTLNGSIGAMGITDENGTAITLFTPYGRVDSSEAAVILAEYQRGSLVHQASANTIITIMPIRSIGFVTASLQQQEVTANGEDSSLIFITVQDSTGAPIADGAIVNLEHRGIGSLSPTQVQTEDGQARAKITAPPNIVGPPELRLDSIFVIGQVNDSTSIADTVVVTYVPDDISQMEFTYPESTITLVAGSGATDSVVVLGKDANGNPVRDGTQIEFRNELSTSSLSPDRAPTVDGFARITYLVGTGTGDDNVTAFIPKHDNPNDTIRTVHPVVFRCISSEATTMDLNAVPPSVRVGGSSSQIIGTLEDAYGNPLSEGYWVAYDITVSPGTLPGQKPSFSTQYLVEHDTIVTNTNGQAIIQLYSGTKPGAVSIRACTIDSIFVCNEKALVSIASGPPAYINIAPQNLGESMGGAERFVQVSAIVTDRYSNEVEYGTAVYFTLLPPDLAEIEGSSLTGAPKPYHPDSLLGVAPTRIIYGCFATFDTVQVIACSAGDSAEVCGYSNWFELPIFEGELSMTALPGNLWTDLDTCQCNGGPNRNCRDTSEIAVTLRDGGGCAIEGGIIEFSAQNAGWIIGQQIDTTDNHGRAYTRYMIRGCDIPIQPDGLAWIEGTVRAVLQQKPDVFGEINIVSRRPVAGPE